MLKNIFKKEMTIVAVLLIAISFLNFSQLFLYHRYPVNDSDNNWVFGSLYYFAKTISCGQLPLWNNLFFTGKPFYDQEILANPLSFLSLAFALLLKIFRDPYYAYSLILLTQITLMGIFTYIISRKVFNLPVLASYFPAVIYMLNMGQKERIFMMPGGFMIAPLLILCADRISKGRVIFYSVICGVLQAAGFYLGSYMSSTWAALIFVYFLSVFLVLKNGISLVSIKKLALSITLTYAVFLLLTASVSMPFIAHLPLYHNLTARTTTLNLSQVVDMIRLKAALFDALFGNIFGFENIISTQTYDFPILTGNITQSLPAYVLFGGSWNYLSVLLIPLFLFFLLNIKLFDAKEKAVGLLLIVYFLHAVFLSFNHVLFLELFFLRGHNIFIKLHFIMQLIGGLFIGIVISKFLILKKSELTTKSQRFLILSGFILLVTYAVINIIFCTGLAFKAFSEDKLASIIQSILTYFIGHVPALSYIMTKFGPDILAKIIDKTGFLMNHFFSSEFTINYLFVFGSRFSQIIFFLLLLRSFSEKDINAKKIKLISVFICLFLVLDRINILKLYSPFNKDAPKNFSENYPEIKYLKRHINNSERVVVVNNDYESIRNHIQQKMALPGEQERALSQFVNEQIFYSYLKDFPESTRNGAPLMNLFNLPVNINTINGVYTDVPPEIWEAYNRMNIRSGSYKLWMESTKGITIGDLNYYDVESPLYDLLGVKYVLSSLPLQSKKLKFIFRGDKYFVYENKKAFPRIWFADKNIVFNDKNKILESLDSGAINMTDKVLSAEPILLPASSEKLLFATQLLDYKPNSVKIEATVNKKSIMVLSDTFFPDWHVYVNGVEKKIERVNYFLRGVVLEPGQNTVIFKFRPYLFYFSCVISIFSILILIGYFIIQNQNWRQK